MWLVYLTSTVSRSVLPKLTQTLFNEAWTVLTDCNLDHDILPSLSKFEPSPTSLQNLIHWGQLIKSEAFQSFTYPSSHKHEAPKVELYDLQKITDVPVAIFYGTQDYLANPQDVEGFLMKNLKSLFYSKKLEGFKHNDFVWGKQAMEEIYIFVLHLLTQKSSFFQQNSPRTPRLSDAEMQDLGKCLLPTNPTEIGNETQPSESSSENITITATNTSAVKKEEESTSSYYYSPETSESDHLAWPTAVQPFWHDTRNVR